MLRRGAEDGAMADTVIVPEADPAREDGMRMENASGADFRRPLDANVRPDIDILGNLRVGMDDGGGMDGHGRIIFEFLDFIAGPPL